MASWDFLTANSAVLCFLLITSLPSLLVQAKESNSCRPEVSTSPQLASYFLVKLIHLQHCFYFSVQKKNKLLNTKINIIIIGSLTTIVLTELPQIS